MNNKKIGVFMATMIVASNMMGSGIALLPSSLATIGSITIISWIIAICGAMSLAYVFATLGLTDPEAGGPVAYASKLSPILGFQAQTLYFNANWVGNLAIATTAIAYLQPLIPAFSKTYIAGTATIAIIWVAALLNLKGVKAISALASFGLTLILIPIIATAIFGFTKFSTNTFLHNWNVTHQNNAHAVISGVLLCIWSFIGIESASVDSDLVKTPKKTILTSTLFGVIIASTIYLTSTTVISGMFDAKSIAASHAPFSMAIATLTTPFLGKAVSLCMAIACFTSLGSWMMLVAQAGSRASQEGNFPKIFSERNDDNVPVKGIICNSLFMTTLMLFFMFYHASVQKIFNDLISISVLLTVVPYFYSSLYFITLTPRSYKGYIQFTITLVAILFCLTAFMGAALTTLVSATIISFIVLIFYANKQRTPNR